MENLIITYSHILVQLPIELKQVKKPFLYWWFSRKKKQICLLKREEIFLKTRIELNNYINQLNELKIEDESFYYSTILPSFNVIKELHLEFVKINDPNKSYTYPINDLIEILIEIHEKINKHIPTFVSEKTKGYVNGLDFEKIKIQVSKNPEDFIKMSGLDLYLEKNKWTFCNNLLRENSDEFIQNVNIDVYKDFKSEEKNSLVSSVYLIYKSDILKHLDVKYPKLKNNITAKSELISKITGNKPKSITPTLHSLITNQKTKSYPGKETISILDQYLDSFKES